MNLTASLVREATAALTDLDFGLGDEFDNPEGFPGVSYYRLNARGREFAHKACESWSRRPLLERSGDSCSFKRRMSPRIRWRISLFE